MSMSTLNPNRAMDVDSVLRCPGCHGVSYKIFRRQHQQADGTLLPAFENVLWPMGSGVMPPLHPECICCPDCGCELKRGAP